MIWQSQYERTYFKILKDLNIDHEFLNVEEFMSTSVNDFEQRCVFWPMHYNHLKDDVAKKLLALKRVKDAKVIFRVSGTSANPECYQVDMIEEQFAVESLVDINMTFSQRMANIMKDYFPKGNFQAIGYPVEVDNYMLPDVEEKEKTILIGGRLTPDKQPLLAMRLLKPYLSNYRIKFCYPDRAGKDTEVFDKYYGGFARYEREGFEFCNLSHLSWIKECKSAEFYFTCSLGDTMCVSLVEAASLGCYILAPNYEHLPAFSTYVSSTYEPFCSRDIRNRIEAKPTQSIDNSQFDPTLFGERFDRMFKLLTA